MPRSETSFQSSWLSHPDCKGWLASVPNKPHYASCVVCPKEFTVLNMGFKAVTSHAEGRKHKEKLKLREADAIGNFVKQREQGNAVGDVAPVNLPSSSSTVAPIEAGNNAAIIAAPTSTKQAFGPLSQDALEAEILWSLRLVEQHESFNSCKNVVALFQRMFKCPIAAEMKLGATKASYYVTFGLAPFFSQQLSARVARAGYFVALFDEAFNRIIQRGQMDVHVRFWDESANIVKTRFLGSAFLGRATAEDLLAQFQAVLKGLNLKNILQISMDGPAVNHKFLKEFSAKYHPVSAGGSQLLDIGSCGLHVVHGAMRAGHIASKWGLNKFLNALFYLFKDSPARRSAFIQLTGTDKFALKFCAHRWVENGVVLDRAFEIMPAFRKYVAEISPQPDVESFSELQTAFKDPFLSAKLHVFRSICDLLEPFLKRFQSDQPLAPFLYDELYAVVLGLLRRFVKEPKVTEGEKDVKVLLKLPLDSDCHRKDEEITIGFGAKRALPSSASALQLKTFNETAKKIFAVVAAKICERSPLKEPLTRALSFLSPKGMTGLKCVARTRLECCLDILTSAQRVPDAVADRAKVQFDKLLADDAALFKFRSYGTTDRLDKTWHDLIGSDESFADLWTVVKLLLMLSHGNASVESGFSINESLLVENLKERSTVAQRIVYDAIKACGGVVQMDVSDRDLHRSVKGSSAAYKAALLQKQSEDRESLLRKEEAARAEEELKTLMAQKRKNDAEAASAASVLNAQIAEAQNTVKRLKRK